MIEIIDRDNKGSLQFWRRGHERVRHLVSQVTLHLIYQALIHPLFNYRNTVWRNCGITLRNKFQTLQNRAVRVLTFSDYDEDAGYLNSQGRKIYRASMKLKKPRFAIRETAYNLRDSENILCIHYHTDKLLQK